MKHSKLEIHIEVNPASDEVTVKAKAKGSKKLLQAALMTLFGKDPAIYELFREAVLVKQFANDNKEQLEEIMEFLKDLKI